MQTLLKLGTVTSVLLPALGAASGCKLEKVERFDGRDQQGFSMGREKMLNSIFNLQIHHHQHTRHLIMA